MTFAAVSARAAECIPRMKRAIAAVFLRIIEYLRRIRLEARPMLHSGLSGDANSVSCDTPASTTEDLLVGLPRCYAFVIRRGEALRHERAWLGAAARGAPSSHRCTGLKPRTGNHAYAIGDSDSDYAADHVSHNRRHGWHVAKSRRDPAGQSERDQNGDSGDGNREILTGNDYRKDGDQAAESKRQH